MKKDEFDGLLARVESEEQRKRLMLSYYSYGKLYNKFIETGSVRDKKNYEAAAEDLQKVRAEIFPDEETGKDTSGALPNIAAVLTYLKDNGWKVTKTTLYRHQKEGRVIPQPGGLYLVAAVNKYAQIHLKQSATGKKVSAALDELQEKKTRQELKNLELKYDREKFNYEKEQGLYIPREQVEIELATRAGVLVAGLKHWVQSKAADWIASVSGDNKRVGELINTMNRDVDEHINHYASSKEYEVVIDAEPESVIPAEAGIQGE